MLAEGQRRQDGDLVGGVEPADVHGRVAEVGCLVIDQREARVMRQNVLRTEVGVTQRVGAIHHLLDQRPDSAGDLGAALLNAERP